MSTDKPGDVIRYVYAGRRTGTKGIVYAYAVEGGDLDNLAWYKKPYMAGLRPGSIVAVTNGKEPGTYVSAGADGPQYVGRLEGDEDRVLRWAAADAAADAEKMRKSTAAKAGDDMTDLLDRVTSAAGGMTTQQRRAFAVMLLERVTR